MPQRRRAFYFALQELQSLDRIGAPLGAPLEYPDGHTSNCMQGYSHVSLVG